MKSETFLLPSSDKLKLLIPLTLDELGIDWTRLDLYRTVVSDLSDLEDVFYDVLVFFSPSGIDSLFKNFPDFKQNNTRIAVFEFNHSLQLGQALKSEYQAPTPKSPSMTMAHENYIKDVNKK